MEPIKAGGEKGGATTKPAGTVDSFAWVNVSYFYKTTKDKKTIEKAAVADSTGLVTKGEMVAVMGPSGAGKSSLFDLLARHASARGRAVGSFYINGREMSDKNFHSISEYVQSDDVFVPTQTMESALLFHTNLRLGPTVSKKDKRMRIMELVKEAGLSDKLKSWVGGPLAGGITVKGLSSGEKRRLSVVCAAIANPSILFLDEPTSGLDAFAAFKVMEMMAKFTMGRRLVICTVHQPRPQIFELFNKVLILSQGRQVYYGNIASVAPWFEEKLQRPLPTNTSLPDHLIDVVNVSFEGLGGISSSKAPGISTASPRDMEMDGSIGYSVDKRPFNVFSAAQTFKEDSQYASLMASINEIRTAGLSAPPLSLRGKNASSWLYKFKIVFKRNFGAYVKNPGNALARFITTIVIGGVIFYRTMDKDNHFVATIAFLICMFTTQLQSILTPFVTIPIFLEDRKFFVKESESSLYPTSAYFAANALLEVMLVTINATAYSTITYYLSLYSETGEQAFTWQRFILYLVAVLGVAYSGTVQAITSAILSPSQDIASAINISICCIFAFGSIPSNLLSFARVIQWASPLKYSYTAMINIFFTGASNEDFVRLMGIDDSPYLVNIGAMLAFCVVFNIIGFWGLKNLYRKKF